MPTGPERAADEGRAGLGAAMVSVLPEAPTAPVTKAARLGRMLRWLAAVDERLMAWVPTERAKYTALGGVVLGTAAIATLSMTTALAEVRGGFQLLLLLPALVWGAFVCNLDRWLVSTSSGAAWHRRASIFLPRLVLAFLFGCVIAEPLVLKVFESAIEKHIQDARQADLRNLESTLLRCNPDPTADAKVRTVADTPGCADYQLNLQASYAAMNQELANRQKEATTLRASIATDRKEQARRDMLASNECAGTPGPGTTGTRGRGPECLAREREAADYRRTNPIAPQTARLEDLSAQISTLQAESNSTQRDYQAKRDAEVAQKVADRKANQGPIGLLERFSALDTLTATSTFLFTATWFIRLFFIAVDCLPVLVKFIGGVTKYEELVDFRVNAARRVFEQSVKTTEAAIVGDLKSNQEESRTKESMRSARIRHDERWHQAEIDVELEQQIDELAKRLHTSRASKAHTNGSAVRPNA
jgi:uncharacterized protein DUF4407